MNEQASRAAALSKAAAVAMAALPTVVAVGRVPGPIWPVTRVAPVRIAGVAPVRIAGITPVRIAGVTPVLHFRREIRRGRCDSAAAHRCGGRLGGGDACERTDKDRRHRKFPKLD